MEKKNSINIRLSDVDLQDLKASAEQVGMNISDYVRNTASRGIERVLHDPEVKTDIREVLSEIRKIEVSIKEISGHAEKDIPSLYTLQICQRHLLEANKKLRYIMELLKMKEEAVNNGNHEA